MKNNDLAWLTQWYYQQCDGDWEHCYGIKIETIDNPGWSLEVPILETELAERSFQKVSIDRTEHDWVRCFVENGYFKAAGGPFNLSEILNIFQKWAKD